VPRALSLPDHDARDARIYLGTRKFASTGPVRTSRQQALIQSRVVGQERLLEPTKHIDDVVAALSLGRPADGEGEEQRERQATQPGAPESRRRLTE
jgi:hypothetical protein